MSSDAVVIVAAKRSPLGAFQGALSGASSPDLAAAAIQACIEESGVDASAVDEVFMGCVLPAGVGQAPARQAAIQAGIPLAAGCTTLNKVCGSGMKASMLGNDLIRAGSAGIVIAGGMESMTNAPYLMPKARVGYRMGHHTRLPMKYPTITTRERRVSPWAWIRKHRASRSCPAAVKQKLQDYPATCSAPLNCWPNAIRNCNSLRPWRVRACGACLSPLWTATGG